MALGQRLTSLSLSIVLSLTLNVLKLLLFLPTAANLLLTAAVQDFSTCYEAKSQSPGAQLVFNTLRDIFFRKNTTLSLNLCPKESSRVEMHERESEIGAAFASCDCSGEVN